MPLSWKQLVYLRQLRLCLNLPWKQASLATSKVVFFFFFFFPLEPELQPSEVVPSSLTLALFFPASAWEVCGTYYSHLIFSVDRVLVSDSSVYPLQNSREDVRATPSGPCMMVLCRKPLGNGPGRGAPTLQRCQPRRAVSMWASFPLSRCRSPQLHAVPAVLMFGDLLSWTTPFSPNYFWLLFDVLSCPLPFASCACGESCSWGNSVASLWNFSKQRSRNYSGLHLFEFSLSFH